VDDSGMQGLIIVIIITIINFMVAISKYMVGRDNVAGVATRYW
jgi:type III secretory pathway component EscV